MTSATTPASATSTRASELSVRSDVLPDQRRAHAQADAERGQPVARVRPLAEPVGELREQPHAGRGQWVATGDRAAVGVEPLVLGIDAQPVAPAQHLHRERLVQLEQAELVERQTRPLQRLSAGTGRGPSLGLDARKRVGDQPHARLERVFGQRLLGGEQRDGRAVGQARRIACRHAATRPEGRRQRRERLQRRLRPQELVAVGRAPPVVGEDRHRDDRLAHDAVLPRRGRALLRAHGVGVRVLLGQLWEAVVQVLGGRAHRYGRGIDEPLGDEARVEVDVVAHRVVAHVLDAAGEDEVGCAHRDLAGAGGDRGECPGAHPVDREARPAQRQAGEQRDVAAERQALVADLRGRRHHHIVDPLGRQGRVAAQQLADDLDAQIVGPRAPEDALRACPAERGADAVDVENLPQLAHVKTLVNRHTLATLP